MNAEISLFNNDTLAFVTTDDKNVLSVRFSSSSKDVSFCSAVAREQVVSLLGSLHNLLIETNGELKRDDVIIIGHRYASAGVLDDYSDKVGLRAIVVDPNALWETDNEGNEVRFVWAALEGKKRNKYVDIHINDAIRVTV